MGHDLDQYPPGSTAQGRMTARSWWLIILLFLTAAASYLCRVNISVVGALMMRDLGFSQIDLGRLFSAFLLGYALFQIPAGGAADRWGARRVLGWAALWWVLATGLISLLGWRFLGGTATSALTVLCVLRFVLGVGEAPTFPAAGQGVARWIPPARRGLANGIVMAAVGAGSAIAPLVLSHIMVRWGWRVALRVSAFPAMAVALAWMLSPSLGDIFPRPARDQVTLPPRNSFWSSEKRAQTGPMRTKSILWSPSFMLLTLSYTLEGYVGYIFVFWFYLYLVQVRHFDLLRAGRLGSIPWLLSMVSIPLGGVISDYLVLGPLGPCWGRRAVPVAGLAFSGIFLALGAHTGNANFAVVYLALATASVLSSEGPFWATMVDLAGPHSGTAGGVMNFGSNVGGVVSPVLTPIMAAYMGWQNALYVGAAVALLSAGLWLGISPQAFDRIRAE